MSKLDKVLNLISRPQGASVAELCECVDQTSYYVYNHISTLRRTRHIKITSTKEGRERIYKRGDTT